MSDETKGDMWLTLHVDGDNGHHKLSWVIDSFTDGPDNTFVMFDQNSEERLLIKMDELMELKNKEEGK